MSDWSFEHKAILNWWPIQLAGKDPEGKIFLNAMEEMAWACENENEWKLWFDQANKIWSDTIRSADELSDDDIYSHFGPTMGQAIRHKIQNGDIEELYFTLGDEQKTKPIRNKISKDIIDLAVKLQKEFGLKSIYCSSSSSPNWIKKQLTDAYMGWSNLALIMGIPSEKIGDRNLTLWLYENSPYSGVSYAQPNHLEIHKSGGNCARVWMMWKIENAIKNGLDIFYIMSSWMRSWRKNNRGVIEYQNNFINKSQNSFKLLSDQVPVTSQMGQKAFRRYRAICKWFDDIRKGMPIEMVNQTWNKVKVGNRIAWSTDDGNNTYMIKNWIWEERLIEAAFMQAPQWHIPSWVQRSRALSSDVWHRDWDNLSEEECITLWGLGFEAIIRGKIGYDGWIATEQLCHPEGIEKKDFMEFFEENIKDILEK